MGKVPAGGADTINGVTYQMLNALLTVAHMRIERAEIVGNETHNVQLILEPEGGGGDQQQPKDDNRTVEQFKARTTDKAWSLKEVIEEVLPDLYKAVDLSKANCRYRFVTESSIGNGQEVLNWFRSLKKVATKGQDDGQDFLSLIDDKVELSFARKRTRDSFWGTQGYTGRSLFEFIHDKLMQHPATKEEDTAIVRRKLWHLLGNFEFLGGQKAEVLSERISDYLHEIIPDAGKCNDVKKQLLQALQEKAGAGNAKIDADKFFQHSQKPGHFVAGLVAFNVGVELGQLTVIAGCFLAVGLWFRNKPYYRRAITNPASLVIAVIGAYWFVERTFL